MKFLRENKMKVKVKILKQKLELFIIFWSQLNFLATKIELHHNNKFLSRILQGCKDELQYVRVMIQQYNHHIRYNLYLVQENELLIKITALYLLRHRLILHLYESRHVILHDEKSKLSMHQFRNNTGQFINFFVCSI